MQMFGGKFDHIFEDEEKPRNNFDSFWGALITVFQVRTVFFSQVFITSKLIDLSSTDSNGWRLERSFVHRNTGARRFGFSWNRCLHLFHRPFHLRELHFAERFLGQYVLCSISMRNIFQFDFSTNFSRRRQFGRCRESDRSWRRRTEKTGRSKIERRNEGESWKWRRWNVSWNSIFSNNPFPFGTKQIYKKGFHF